MIGKNLNTFFFFTLLALSCISWEIDKGEKEALNIKQDSMSGSDGEQKLVDTLESRSSDLGLIIKRRL